jgi:condensin complex subunit 2
MLTLHLLLFSTVAFTVDPLYQQTSAQFDEGGARGLLLNTLGVYNDCRIMFDSWDIPGKNMKSGFTQNRESFETINVSFIKGIACPAVLPKDLSSFYFSYPKFVNGN